MLACSENINLRKSYIPGRIYLFIRNKVFIPVVVCSFVLSSPLKCADKGRLCWTYTVHHSPWKLVAGIFGEYRIKLSAKSLLTLYEQFMLITGKSFIAARQITRFFKCPPLEGNDVPVKDHIRASVFRHSDAEKVSRLFRLGFNILTAFGHDGLYVHFRIKRPKKCQNIHQVLLRFYIHICTAHNFHPGHAGVTTKIRLTYTQT